MVPPPPPGPVFIDPPPAVYAEPPPGWGDPPPGYGDPPPAGSPPRGRLLVAPDGTYFIEPLPDDEYGGERLMVRPDEGDDYGYPGEPYPDDDRSRATIYGYEEAPGLSNRGSSGGWRPEERLASPPDYDQAPPIDDYGQSADIAPSAGRQIDVLATYAPAKREAVSRSDPLARLDATKKVNAWLVSTSLKPATAATIRAIDKILGIDVSDQRTTALPGAGTSVDRPKAKSTTPADDEGLSRIGAYIDARRGTADAAAAAVALSQGSDKKQLDAEEIAGLDAFLGFVSEEAVVEAPRTDGRSPTGQAIQ